MNTIKTKTGRAALEVRIATALILTMLLIAILLSTWQLLHGCNIMDKIKWDWESNNHPILVCALIAYITPFIGLSIRIWRTLVFKGA